MEARRCRHAPGPSGLYDPRFEHDSCGVSFVAHIKGVASHELVRDRPRRADQPRAPRRHRAPSPTPATAPASSIQVPDRFLRAVLVDGSSCPPAGALRRRHRLPARRRRGRRQGAGGDRDDRRRGGADRARLARRAGRRPDCLGATARAAMPAFRQLFVADPDRRRRASTSTARRSSPASASSTSSPTSSRRTSRRCRRARSSTRGCSRRRSCRRSSPTSPTSAFESALLLVHSRFSTNTFPSWPLAHPYRFIAHNGEINTVQGNQNWMRAREAMLASPHAARPRARRSRSARPARPTRPASTRCSSCSTSAGRPLHHAVLMMIPEAWENNADDGRRPAGVLPVPRLADGAVGRPGQRHVHRRHRDRRRARPQRPAAQPLLGHRRRPRRDGVRGRRDRHRPGQGRRQGPPAAGPHVPDRHRRGPHRRRRGDQGARSPPSTRTASGSSEGLVELADLPRTRARRVQPRQRAAPPADVRLHPRGAEDHRRPDGEPGRRADRLDGHRHADRRAVGAAAAAVRLLLAAVRAGHQPAARRHPRGGRHRRSPRPSGPRPTCSRPGPESCRQLALPFPIIDNDELAKIIHANDDGEFPGLRGARRARVCTASPAAGWRCERALDGDLLARCRRRSTTAPASSCCRDRNADEVDGADPVAAAHRRPCTTTSCARSSARRSA